MTELELQEKIDELRQKRRGKREESVDYNYDYSYEETQVVPQRKDDGAVGALTTQSIIVVVLVIIYILALTFFPKETKAGLNELKGIIQNDFSFKDTVYQAVGDLLTDLNLSVKTNDATVVSSANTKLLDGMGGEKTVAAGKSLPYNATLADVIYTGSITYPVSDSRNTSKFGFRKNPITNLQEFHNALDIAAVHGSSIYAAADGVVVKSGFDSSLGNYIVLDHTNGFKTKYGHCSELLVKNGTVVKEGEVIAKVGSTGDSTGPHVHFAASKNGVYFNPQHLYTYVEKWGESINR